MPNAGHDGPSHPTRRCVLRCTALGTLGLPLLASCGAASEASNGCSTSVITPSGGSENAVAASDVSVGGGVILEQAQVVVTQPRKGDFKGFSAVCTHLGCLVDVVCDGQIVCPCHGSHYSITDGSVLSGPARRPLPSLAVTVEGGRITVR